MGKYVLVKCVQIGDAMDDMTIGNIYAGYLPEQGEIDVSGLEVQYDDEIWVWKDDIGDEVITTLSDGLVVVSE